MLILVDKVVENIEIHEGNLTHTFVGDHMDNLVLPSNEEILNLIPNSDFDLNYNDLV